MARSDKPQPRPIPVYVGLDTMSTECFVRAEIVEKLRIKCDPVREKIRGVIVLLSDPDRGVIVLLHFPTVQRHDSRSNGMTPGG
jgi:hypothetical protein